MVADSVNSHSIFFAACMDDSDGMNISLGSLLLWMGHKLDGWATRSLSTAFAQAQCHMLRAAALLALHVPCTQHSAFCCFVSAASKAVLLTQLHMHVRPNREALHLSKSIALVFGG